jgi:hypothetical protein
VSFQAKKTEPLLETTLKIIFVHWSRDYIFNEKKCFKKVWKEGFKKSSEKKSLKKILEKKVLKKALLKQVFTMIGIFVKLHSCWEINEILILGF